MPLQASDECVRKGRAAIWRATSRKGLFRAECTLAAGNVELVRIVGGILLVIYFARHLKYTTQFVGANGLGQSGAAPASVFGTVANGLEHASHEAVQLWFGIGIFLAAFVTIGLAPRLSSLGLLLVAGATNVTLFPVWDLDDAGARMVSFWLVVLPTGRNISVTARSWRSWSKRPLVASYAMPACAAFFALVVLEQALTPGSGLTSTGRLSLVVAAALVVLPIGTWRALALLPAAVGLWGMLQPGDAFITATFLAALAVSNLLPYGMHVARKTVNAQTHRTPSTVPLTTAGAVAVTALGLYALNATARYAHASSIAYSSGAMLFHAGLAPPKPVPGQRRTLDLAFICGGAPCGQPIETQNPRFQLMIQVLASSPHAQRDFRLALLRFAVATHCRRNLQALAAVGDVVLSGDTWSASRVASFRCGRDGEENRVVLVGRAMRASHAT